MVGSHPHDSFPIVPAAVHTQCGLQWRTYSHTYIFVRQDLFVRGKTAVQLLTAGNTAAKLGVQKHFSFCCAHQLLLATHTTKIGITLYLHFLHNPQVGAHLHHKLQGLLLPPKVASLLFPFPRVQPHAGQ